MVATKPSIGGGNKMQVSTSIVVAPMRRRVGRKRINATEGDNMTARFAEGTMERLKAAPRPRGAPVRRRGGRKRINATEGDEMTARFAEGTMERIKAVLRPGEPQSAFIRD